SDALFPTVVAPRAPIVRPRRRPSGNPPTPVRKRGLARRLLLEVTGPETGQGREIQVPKASLEEFFGIRPEDVLYMTFVHGDGTIERNRPLASYANQTYRISSSRFRAVPRPSIVELARARAQRDTFRVLIHRPNSPGYASAQALLTRGGGQS